MRFSSASPSYDVLLDQLQRQNTLTATLEHKVKCLELALAQKETELHQALARYKEHGDDGALLAAELTFLFEHALDLLVVHAAGGELLRVSPSVQALLGYTPQEFAEQGMQRLVHPEDYPKLQQHISTIAKGVDGLNYVTRCRHKNGEWRWFSWTTPSAQPSGCKRMFALGRDVTVHELEKQQLQHRAGHDLLTGLPNRHTFNTSLEHALARATRSGRPLALMLIDLDGFKAINDTHGHHAGDIVLQAVAGRLAAVQRRGDVMARLGGDEFVCVLEDTSYDAAGAAAARMVDTVAEPITVGTGQVRVGCSIGIATFAGEVLDSQLLFQQADCAMYSAKHGGKRGYRHFPG
jgi:diguanylate cyclase (GGDEF)-like protein/PAS domain S-box-containing protein